MSLFWKILRNTFKDEEKKLVTNLIYYFENRSNSNYNSLSIYTTNYEHTYESMVHDALNSLEDHNFIKEDYSICDNNSHYIDIDHIDETNKIIVDSKYYINDITNVDYKQLFYLQHISSNLDMDSFIERKRELNKWVNVLITPSNEYKAPSSIVKRKSKDGLNLYTQQISINDLISHYYYSNDLLIHKISSGINLMRDENMQN